MNQDQVKELLLRLEDDVQEFNLIFSGKKSKKANGLYYPDTREIIIHNQNFSDDNALIYTAVHEFAHHVHFTRSAIPVGPKSHTIEFRTILHTLLERAEQMQIYRSIFRTNPEFMALTFRIKKEFLTANGRLMKEFGSVLQEAQKLCEKYQARFDDYIERVLSMERKSVNTILKIQALDLKPELGYENMGTVARIADPDKRAEAEEAFTSGKSPDMVKAMIREDETAPDPAKKLAKEKRRIERTISSLQQKLEEIDARLERLEQHGTASEAVENIRQFPS